MYLIKMKKIIKYFAGEKKYLQFENKIDYPFSDYLLYAPCWKNVSTDERKCALQYKRLAHSTDPEKDVNDNLKLHCW